MNINIEIIRLDHAKNISVLNYLATIGGGRFGIGGGAKPQGSGGRKSPSGVQGGAPVWRGRSPQKLNNFKNSYKQILRIFW